MTGSSGSPETVSVAITDMALPRDFGVGRWEERVLFVPGAIPGDRMRVEIVGTRGRVAYGKPVCLESASPWRRDPPCPHFGLCGGCSMLQVEYPSQLDIKGRHLQETLRRVGGITLEPGMISPVSPSVDQFFYRGKIELTYRLQGGRYVLGMKRRVYPLEAYEGEVVHVRSCRLFSPLLETVLPVLEDYLESWALPSYDEKKRRGFLKGVTIREAKSTGHAMLIVETARGDQLPGHDVLVAGLQRACPSLKNVYRLCEGSKEILYGQEGIEEVLGGASFLITPTAFFQPNPKTAQLLYREVIDFAGEIGARRVLGLYCGMGTLEIILSGTVQSVEGYDADPENIGSARMNCRVNGIENCRFHTRRVEDLSFGPHHCDLVVLDPPRTGMTRYAMASLLNLKVPHLAYISCDPATLARDMKVIMEAGYRVLRIRPFDFFPHTSHLETLVLLRRKG